MHPDFATSDPKEAEWGGMDEQPRGVVSEHLQRLNKSVAQLVEVAVVLEDRIRGVLTPEQELPQKADIGGTAPQPLHSSVAMTLGDITNKIERVNKKLEGMRERVEL